LRAGKRGLRGTARERVNAKSTQRVAMLRTITWRLGATAGSLLASYLGLLAILRRRHLRLGGWRMDEGEFL
jgi:hypothetical protein